MVLFADETNEHIHFVYSLDMIIRSKKIILSFKIFYRVYRERDSRNSQTSILIVLYFIVIGKVYWFLIKEHKQKFNDEKIVCYIMAIKMI